MTLMTLVGVAYEVASSQHVVAVLGTERPPFFEELRKEHPRRTYPRHDTHENEAAGSCDTAQFGECGVGSVHHIAERPPEAHHRVEVTGRQRRQVADVAHDTSDDSSFAACGLNPFGIELQLDRRQLDDVDQGSKLREFDRESPRSGSRVQYNITRTHELGEVATMDREARSCRPCRVVTVPFLLCVRVVVLSRVFRIVRQRHWQTVGMPARSRSTFSIQRAFRRREPCLRHDPAYAAAPWSRAGRSTLTP